MGKKKAKNSKAKPKGKGKSKAEDFEVCAGCKNFKSRKDGSGYCKRKDKKRAPDDKACSHFDPR